MIKVIIEVKDLFKSYGNFEAVKGISFEVMDGEIFGLLGPNGAGKSTLMRILATITKPTEGRVLLQGHDIVRSPEVMRTVLGYLPQDFGIYPHLNAVEFLGYLAALRGVGGRCRGARAGVTAPEAGGRSCLEVSLRSSHQPVEELAEPAVGPVPDLQPNSNGSNRKGPWKRIPD